VDWESAVASGALICEQRKLPVSPGTGGAHPHLGTLIIVRTSAGGPFAKVTIPFLFCAEAWVDWLRPTKCTQRIEITFEN